MLARTPSPLRAAGLLLTLSLSLSLSPLRAPTLPPHARYNTHRTMTSTVQAKALVLLVMLSVCSICPTAVDAGRCDPQPHLIFNSNCYPWGLCAGGVCCDCPSGVALYKSPRFTCKVDTSISGTADVKLSNGKTEDTGFSASKCDSECTSKSACQSFVWKESDGYEL